MDLQMFSGRRLLQRSRQLSLLRIRPKDLRQLQGKADGLFPDLAAKIHQKSWKIYGYHSARNKKMSVKKNRSPDQVYSC